MKLPETADVRMCSEGGQWCVVITCGPNSASIAELMKPGTIIAILTHDPGLTWTDRKGEALAQAVIDAHGAVILIFHTLADAMTCQGKLRKMRS